MKLAYLAVGLKAVQMIANARAARRVLSLAPSVSSGIGTAAIIVAVAGVTRTALRRL